MPTVTKSVAIVFSNDDGIIELTCVCAVFYLMEMVIVTVTGTVMVRKIG